MKALSLKQPWAELILQGRKTVELRKWNTKFRGKFLIHASKKPDEDGMKEFGFDGLPCGCIVGEAELVDVKNYNETGDFDEDKDKHLANSDWGGFGFLLEDVKRIKEIPWKGALGFWECEIH